MLIYVAIPGDRNVIKTEAEKILKYKNLIIEVQRKWNVKEKVIPIARGATGIISKSLRQYLSNIPREQEIKEQPTTMDSANVKVCLFVRFWRKNSEVDQGLLIHEVSRSHQMTHHSR